MAHALRIRCKNCEKICPAEQIPLELFSLLSTEEQELLFNIQAMYVYCQIRKERCFIKF